MIDLTATFLPTGPLRLVSRVASLADDAITCETDIAEHWSYAHHFPGDPVFPGCLMVELAAQATLLWGWAQGHRGRPRLGRTSAEFHSPATPADGMLITRSRVRKRRNVYFGEVEIAAGERAVASVSVVVALA
ncbi:MAG TPA: hypothetical protein VNK43_05110 [Gemmatimonadales bacterium]|nr:hypothetical protein [Gemmatimonadales bacterium]